MTNSAQERADRKLALVIGATGSFGGHAVSALIKHGWRIRALARDPAAAALKAGPLMPIEWVEGDGLNAEDVTRAARGVAAIVHAANPPKYHNWPGLVLPMLEATIAAAVCEKARIIFPASVYNFSPDAGPRIAEDARQAPATRKGAIRVEAEARLKAASEAGARVLVLRAGDFFGPAAPNGALTWLVNGRAGRVRSVYAPGPVDVGHAFAYLPDLAETMARLMDREEDLADHEVFHFAGHWLARGDELAKAVRRAAGDPKIPMRPFPYPLIIALSPFVEMFRELLEMRYLWRKPIGLDDAKLRAFLGEVPATRLDAAVRETLADRGLLNPARGGALRGGETGRGRPQTLDAAHV